MSKTRASPYFSARPGVVTNTPPATAMSSPNRITFSSRASSSSRASRTAVRNSTAVGSLIVLTGRGPPEIRGAPAGAPEMPRRRRRRPRGDRTPASASRTGATSRCRPRPRARAAGRRRPRGSRPPGALTMESKALMPYMPRFETVNVPSCEVGGRARRRAHALDQRGRLARDLAQRAAVGVAHDGHEQRARARHGDAHVDALVALDRRRRRRRS